MESDPPPSEPVPALDTGTPPASAQRRSHRGSRQVIGPFTVRHLVVANTVLALDVLVLFAALALKKNPIAGLKAAATATVIALAISGCWYAKNIAGNPSNVVTLSHDGIA